MTENHGGHRHRALIVGVEAGQSVLDDAVLHYAESGEYHRKTKCYQTLWRSAATNSTSWAVIVFDISETKESIFPMPSDR